MVAERRRGRAVLPGRGAPQRRAGARARRRHRPDRGADRRERDPRRRRRPLGGDAAGRARARAELPAPSSTCATATCATRRSRATFPLVLVPFRSMLHMETDADRRAVLRAIKRHLAPGRAADLRRLRARGRRHRRHARPWIEREPGIWERADWNEQTRTLVLRVRDETAESEMSLAWLSMPEWRLLLAEEGFEVDALYGWFDRSPWARRRGLDLGLPSTGLTGAATRRARSRPDAATFSDSAPRSGSTPRRRARPRPAAPPAPRRAGTRRGRRDRPRRAASRRALRAQPSFVWSPHKPTARGGRARSSLRSRAAPSATSDRRSRRRATIAAPNASAVRISVPTLPGSASRQSASVAGALLPAGQIGAPVDGDRRAAGAGRSRRRRAASASTSSPARSRSTGSAVAASTASSPSTKKRPSFSRQRRSCSLRTSFRRSLSLETITVGLY